MLKYEDLSFVKHYQVLYEIYDSMIIEGEELPCSASHMSVLMKDIAGMMLENVLHPEEHAREDAQYTALFMSLQNKFTSLSARFSKLAEGGL